MQNAKCRRRVILKSRTSLAAEAASPVDGFYLVYLELDFVSHVSEQTKIAPIFRL
jgi:hypothetical protein